MHRTGEEKFLSVYLPLTDQVIAALSEGALNHGYSRALETLIAMRNSFSDYGKMKT